MLQGTRTARRRLDDLRNWRASRAAASPADVGLPHESVTLISSAGTSLHAWWVPARRPGGPAILGVHGFASHAGDLVPLLPLLHDAGFGVLLLDLRGHGRSEPTAERPRPPTLAQDVHVGVDWLSARADVDAVGLVGHSMGGSTALVAASRDPRVRAVVAVAAVADPTLSRIGWWPAAVSRLLLAAVARRRGSDPRPTFAVTRIREVEAPVLLVHGDRDRIVPLAHGRALAAARPDAELVVVPGAGHASFDDFAPALERATTFLHDALG